MGYLNALRAPLVNGRKISSESHQSLHTIAESISRGRTFSKYYIITLRRFNGSLGATGDHNPHTHTHTHTQFLRRFARGEATVNGRLQSAGSSQCLILRFVTTPDPRPNQGSHVCPIVHYTTLHHSFVDWRDVFSHRTFVNSPLGPRII